MKKLFKNSLLLLLPTTLALPSIISCSQNKLDITSIELFTDSKYFMPGDYEQIRAIIQPYNVRYRDLDWEILESPSSDITINDIGELWVPFSVYIDKPEKLVIKASAPNNHDVFSLINAYVLPYSDSDFYGFENNEIQYVDRQGNTMSMSILRKDDYYYETEANIDVFELYKPPRPFASWFNFKPLVRGENEPYMRFTLVGGMGQTHALSWDGYEDGTWTREIPDFSVYHNSLLFDEIEVNFACNQDVELHIKLATWQAPSESNTGRITYVPEPNNPHRLINEVGGLYSCNAYAPAKADGTLPKQHMHNILFFRPKYEYTDFIIQVDLIDYGKEDPLYDESEEMKKCVHYEINSELVTRECDHYRYYKVDFSYWFDSTERIHNASDWDYNQIQLFRIGATDPMFHDPSEKNYCAICDFYIDWV